ncbi:hypothetical protein [Jeotgalibacillus haloalkalitolerans]|uniref:DUF5079 family protein n=1 Tax=Jeotgalibacillus haloalkalitolerans TaxID=3104292 RepID=A0ABU5KPU4_9BACL|nr:hypothetical protein [Jeotgalibacillus sp. HH7-29]MDZ5712725.1 hypothetical protein [Jeotgalibacillus sp. HH7-29]
MTQIFLGLLLIFFKLDINFLDISLTYSITNLLGYILVFLGVKDLGRKYERIEKVQSLVIFMIFHSVAFLVLNATGNSPLTLPLDSYLAIVSFVGLAFVIAGMFMVFVIISRLIEGIEDGGETAHTRRLKRLCAIMMTVYVLIGMFYFMFTMVPEISQILMGVLLLLKIIFLMEFYNIFMKSKSGVAAER